MARNEKMQGWGERVRRVRERANLSLAEWARRCGVTPGSCSTWETKDSGTSASVIKRGLVALGIPDVPQTLSWLADGQGPEPHWLNDPPGSPFTPEGPGRLVAMPRAALEAWHAGFRVLDQARETGTLREPCSIQAWTHLHRAESELKAESGLVGSAPRDHIIRNDEAVSSSLTASFASPANIISLDDRRNVLLSLRRAQ
jgi:transcriptional regulator with XRE-family HTH domain